MSIDAAAQKLRDWREDPVLFVRENFQTDPEPWQARALHEAAKPGKKRIAMQAAVGVGKSAVKAWAAWHFLATQANPARHPGKYPNGYALSISHENLKSGLWKELGVWRSRSPFLMQEFEWTAETVFHKQHQGTWWVKARSYPKSADPEAQGAALSGLHSPYVAVFLDEVGEMHPAIGRRAEQVLSDAESEFGVILASGNPTTTNGLLYELCARASTWSVIRITGDPDDPHCSARVDKDWAQQQIAEYGRDNPWVMAHILGQFPPGGLNTLLSPDEVREAMQRNPERPAYEWSQKRLGIDVARFGDDRTVIFPRQGLVAFQPQIMRGERTTAIAARVMTIAGNWGSEAELIDDTGHWGHGVVDNLIATGRPAIPVIFSDPALDKRYLNRRAEMWFNMAEWVKRGGALPNIPELVAELTQPTYGLKNGKVALEDKDAIKKRLGRSPDLADALALTFALPDMPGVGSNLILAGNVTSWDYDPFDDKRMDR